MAKQDVPLSTWKQYIARSEITQTITEIADALHSIDDKKFKMQPILTGGTAYVHYALKGLQKAGLTREQALAQIRYNKDIDFIIPSAEHLEYAAAALKGAGFEKRQDRYAKPTSNGQLRKRIPGKIKYKHHPSTFKVPKPPEHPYEWSHNEVDEQGMIHRHVGVDIMLSRITDSYDPKMREQAAKDIVKKAERAEEYGSNVRVEPLRNLIADKLLYFEAARQESLKNPKMQPQTKDAADIINLVYLHRLHDADIKYISKAVGGKDRFASILSEMREHVSQKCAVEPDKRYRGINVRYSSLTDLMDEQEFEPTQVGECLLVFDMQRELPVVDKLIEKLKK